MIELTWPGFLPGRPSSPGRKGRSGECPSAWAWGSLGSLSAWAWGSLDSPPSLGTGLAKRAPVPPTGQGH